MCIVDSYSRRTKRAHDVQKASRLSSNVIEVADIFVTLKQCSKSTHQKAHRLFYAGFDSRFVH